MPPKRSASARAGSRFPSEVVGHNIRSHRSLEGLGEAVPPDVAARRLSQDDLAQRMRELGFSWTHTTVSEVEQAHRSVTVDELFALALSLQTTVAELLDPAGPRQNLSYRVDVGLPSNTVPSVLVRGWVYGDKSHGVLLWGRSGPGQNRIIGGIMTNYESITREEAHDAMNEVFGGTEQ